MFRSEGLRGWITAIVTLAAAQWATHHALADHLGPPAPSVPITAQVRAETRRHAEWYWQWQDSGEPTAAVQFQWSFPVPGTFNPFTEALALFSQLYGDRLNDVDSYAPYSISDLLRDDPLVRLRFREYTLTGEFLTTPIDGIAHSKHVLAVLDALTENAIYTVADASATTTGGLISKDLLIGTPTPIWVPVPGASPLPPANLPSDIEEVKEHIERATEAWKLWLGSAGDVWWIRQQLRQEDSYWDSDTTGFDCDDFADAFGWYLYWYLRENTGQVAPIEHPQVLQIRKPWSFEGHAVTLIFRGLYYWVIDAQTGTLLGPYHRVQQWPPYLIKIVHQYPTWGDQYGFGWPMSYPAGTRPFYEEQPWFQDGARRGRVEELLPSDIPPYYLRPPATPPDSP